MSGVTLNPQNAPATYNSSDQTTFRSSVKQALGQAYKFGTDLVFLSNVRLIKQSPNGAYWEIKVDNAGGLTTAVVTP